MSFFSKLLGSEPTESPIHWIPIDKMETIDEIIERSYFKKAVIFKHSTRCFISKTVLKNFEKKLANSTFLEHYEFYSLDLIRYRAISNAIAEKLDVTHQSPQMIVLENGNVIEHASHSEISTDKLTN